MKASKEDKEIIKTYGHLFNNTGGNDVLELFERKGVTFFNNAVVAAMQICILSQLDLIKKLRISGLLKE